MSHASRATITLGGGAASPSPVTSPPVQYGGGTSQQYGGYPQNGNVQQPPSNSRRRRQNVPEHMRQASQEATNGPSQQTGGSPSQPAGGAPNQNRGGGPVQPAGGAPNQNRGGGPVQPAGGAPNQNRGGGPIQPAGGAPNQNRGGRPRQPTGGAPNQNRGGGMQFGTVYSAKPHVESSTPDQAQQTQSLFSSTPQARQQGDVRYGYNTQPVVQQPPAPVAAPAPQQPAPVSDADARRAEEARQKLIAMNLSPQVVEQYRRKFNVLDLNKDGVVNLREFAAISRVLGYKFSKEEVLEIFGRRDLDDSGGISFDEFVLAMYERSQKSKHLAPYREKFRLYDWKSRGYITTEEAYPILKKQLGFDENKTETLIDMYDRNKDYRLSLLEFIDFYKKVEELKDQVQQAFRDFDRNGDGFVDAEEAKAVLIPKGFSDQQVEALIFKHDKDADGKLNYSEFTSFWDVQII